MNHLLLQVFGFAMFISTMLVPVMTYLWLSERHLNKKWRALTHELAYVLNRRVDVICRQLGEEDCHRGCR